MGLKPVKLVLLDAHAIIHRAYHALPDFRNSAGEPTGGLYGLAAMLLRLINDLKPDYLIACYDLPEATFRKQIYDRYKSGRPKADEDLAKQLESSRELLSALAIPIYDRPGFEADDIIGTIVETLGAKKNCRLIIASGDMDTLQLVRGGQVTVYTLKKGISDTVVYDEAKVKERFGFGPELLPDWKGLRGDPSDNIIGIAGIGEKTATALVKNFGSLEQIYQRLKKDEKDFAAAGLSPRLIKLLADGEEEALFSKTLATIRRDAPIKFIWPERPWRESVDLAKVDELFKRLEFRTLGPRLRAALGQTPAPPSDVGSEKPLPPEFAIAVWLLDSELTSPAAEDLARLGGERAILPEIKKNNLEKVYREIELPLLSIIDRAAARGILVDPVYLKKLSVKMHRELTAVESRIYSTVGQEFNLNSPRQLAEILFDRLRLKTDGLKKTAGGARSTKESELLKLKDVHPVIADILKQRELQKLLSTYVDSLPKLLDREGRLHSRLNQAGTTTGRMSSSNPNLQNIPAGDGFGLEIRRAFLPSPGHVWASFDYSQIEMRVLALLSGDEKLQKIFKSGEDVHTSVAKQVFGVAADNVTREMRRRAKVINFGIIYGMGVNALRANLGTSRAEAQKFYDDYFAAFPKIRGYFNEVKLRATKLGYTETLFGRRRHFPGLKSRLPYVRAMNERMAMNAPLQGTAADIVKIAMKKVDDLIEKRGWRDKVHFLLQVHDELIYEVKKELAEKVLPQIKQAMEAAAPGDLPFAVNAAAGANWAEAK